MIDGNYINTIPDRITNMLHDSVDLKLHDSVDLNLTNLLCNNYSQNEFNNLVLNSNLENYSIIK